MDFSVHVPVDDPQRFGRPRRQSCSRPCAQPESGLARCRLERTNCAGLRHDAFCTDYRSDAGRNAAADVTSLVGRPILPGPGQGEFRQHNVVGECGVSQAMKQALFAQFEPAAAVGRETFSLGLAHRLAMVCVDAGTVLTSAAFGRAERNHVIAGTEHPPLLVLFGHDARALRTESGRKISLGIISP